MTSPAKIAANRRNARRSTGPHSAAGKARARRNAFRHGLASPASLDHAAMDRIDNLVDALTIDVHSQLQFQLATVAAEAQAEIERVRQTKVNLVNRASAQLREEGAGLLSAGERGDAPDFVEVSEAGVAVDDAMRHQCCVQLVGCTWIDELPMRL